MKLNKFYGIVFMLLLTSVTFAQQLPQFTQYMFNTISINPAYAGSRETLSVIGLHRSQWVGLEGGPQTQTLSIHAPLRNEKVGLGLSVINDELGFENFQYVYGDFSYTITTGLNSKLAFGIKGIGLRYPREISWLQPMFEGLTLLIAVAIASRQLVIKVKKRKDSSENAAANVEVESDS